METRETILQNIKDRQTFVTLTPYMFINKENGRKRKNIFTTIEYTETELKQKIDTEGAVEFMKRLLSAIPQHKIDTGLVPMANTSIKIDLGYLVDSRLRKEKDVPHKDITILSDIISITLNFPACSIDDEHEKYTHRQRTFLVNLDEFIASMRKEGWISNIADKADKIVENILESGFSTSPSFFIMKQSQLLSPKDEITLKSHSMHVEMREALIAKFLEDFYPNMFFTKDTMYPYRNLTQPADKTAQNLFVTYRRVLGSEGIREETTHTDLDELVYCTQSFIYESTRNETPSYLSSHVHMLLEILNMTGHSIQDLSIETLENARRELARHILTIETPVEDRYKKTIDELKSYKEKFYNPASHFEEYPQLTRAFQAVLDDFKGILNADDNFIIEKLNEDLDKLNKEVTSLQPTPIDCVRTAETLFSRSKIFLLTTIKYLYDGSYDITLNWSNFKEAVESYGIKSIETPRQLMTMTMKWIDNLLLFLKRFKKDSKRENLYDYDILLSYLINRINTKLAKTKKIEMSPTQKVVNSL